MPDDLPNGTPQDFGIRVVLPVHRLFIAHEAEWHRQESEFLREVAARHKEEDEAEEIRQRAAMAIAEERTAVEAGTAAPRLTDPKHGPGKGWEWRIGNTDDEDRDNSDEDRDESHVEGWMPPDACAADDFLASVAMGDLYWTPQNPSLATTFVLLAIFHDQYLEGGRTILDPVTGHLLEAIQSQDPGVLEFMRLRMKVTSWQKCSPHWPATAESYLVDIEAYLGRLPRDVKADLASGGKRTGGGETPGDAQDGTPTSDARQGETLVPDEVVTSLLALIERYKGELDTETLGHHLRECIDLFGQEKWDSSIGHARNFVEQMLRDVAQAIAKRRDDTVDLKQAVRVREFLRNAGFFTAEHQKLANGLYGYFSEEGSHPGTSTQSDAKMCLRMLWAYGSSVLEKFQDWKTQNA